MLCSTLPLCLASCVLNIFRGVTVTITSQNVSEPRIMNQEPGAGRGPADAQRMDDDQDREAYK
jgi:hypothetical protein